MVTLWQDLRYGLRMLAKSRAFTVVAILTLALGIGANSAIFSCINAWIINPLPYPQSDRLMVFATHDKKNGWTGEHVTSPADFFDFQKQNTSFEQSVAWTGASLNLTGDGSPELVDGGRVTSNFFDTLGAKPILGRTFIPDDDRAGSPHVVILSEGLWQGRYDGDPKIIGRNITIGGEAYTVVGVMPGTFQFPLMGVANLWTPLALTDKQRADRSVNQTMAEQIWPNEDPNGRQLRFGDQHTVGTIVGVVNDVKMYQLRPRPERQMYVPLAQFPSATLGFVVRTTADSTAMATAIRDTIWTVDRDQPISSVEPLETLMVIVDAGNRVLTKLMVFFGVVAMFLGVIGIYGVMSNLVSQRMHEIGIRTALGASPPQVMGMVIGQGLKLALIGIVIGVLGALGAARTLATMLYQVTPYDPLTFISVPIVFAAVAAAACSIPARHAMRVDPIVALRYE